MYRIILIWKIFTLHTFLKFNNGNISKTELNKDLYWKMLVNLPKEKLTHNWFSMTI